MKASRATAIAVALAATCAGAFGSAPGVVAGGGSASVTIYRDAYGIPHVEADDARALAYGTGYVVAEDRAFLLAAIRLLAQGRSAELLGAPSLEADQVMRRDFYDPADVARQYERLPDSIRAELEAFSDGVNDGMAKVLADPLRRPALFDLLAYTPEPWQPTDSVSVAMMFVYVTFAGEGGSGQLRNAELLGRLQRSYGERRGLAIWNDFVFQNDPKGAKVVPRGEGPAMPGSIREERPGAAQIRLARSLAKPLGNAGDQLAAQIRRVEQILRRLPVPRIGSYEVAIGGERSRSGGALLIGSPQAGMNAPPVFYQLGQHAPGRDCVGFTVPGLGPWTGIGWCNDHAWSLVAGNAGEQVDNYVVRTKRGDPTMYRYKGEWRRMRTRTETFEVNFCVPPVCSEPDPGGTETSEFLYTVHGPVVSADPARKIAIVQRRAQRGRWARSLGAVVGWNEARSWKQFEAALKKATGTYNLAYADAAGNIAYRFTGYQPVRAPGIDRRLPSPGNGSFEWRRRTLPFERMPHVVNPASGIIVSNQGVESSPISWWPNASGIGIGQASRIPGNRLILRRLEKSLTRGRLIDANPLLLERRDSITAVFAPLLVVALEGAKSERLQEALAILKKWRRDDFRRVDRDGDGLWDSAAITIFGADNFNMPSGEYPRMLWAELNERVFGDEIAGLAPADDGGTFQIPGSYLASLSRLKLALDGRSASVDLAMPYADDVSTERVETARAQIRAALAAALRALEAEFGTPQMSSWRRPVPETPFEPLGVVAPPPIRGFDHGTYSQIVDPAAGVGSYILAPGNGSADSAVQIAAGELGQYPEHFADQRSIYEAYGFLEMPMKRGQYTADPESVTELTYP